MFAIAIIVIFLVVVFCLISAHLDENKSNNKQSFSSQLGKNMMEKDMIDSMFGNGKLDSFEETLITKNIIDNIKK